jgi:flagellar assembly protein FliH
MSSSNIFKGCGQQLSSIRPYDFYQYNDFKGETLVSCRHSKDTRRFSHADDIEGGSTPSPQPQSPIAVNEQPANQQSSSFWDEVAKNLNDTAQTLGSAIVDISRLRETILSNSIDDMLRLVMAISRQVIQHEIETREELILTIITKALQAAIKADEFHIKINPHDFQVVTENKPLFLASISGLKNITFEADSSITRGGCLVESALGKVDATLDTKLDEIFQQLCNTADNHDKKSG